MAPKGPKPKPAHLRLIDGTHRAARHGDEAKTKKVLAGVATHFGKLACPKFLKGEALAAWKKWIIPAFWLDGSKEAAAIAFCELWAEFRFGPTSFPASKHGQMRAYMSELGLTDERNRIHDSSAKHEDEIEDGFA